jgi:transposase
MANQLSMAKTSAIQSLHQSGHSNRKIARLLGVDRETVGKYVAAQNRPNAPPGSEAVDQASSGPPSGCEPWREIILAKLEQGLSARRIYQDLAGEQGCEASYWSVRRFVGKLRQKTPLPVRRIETSPGEEAQVDFGAGAPVIDHQGKRRRPWMFRVVLSHSRKGYSEVVWRQTTDNFIAALENAFTHFGGVPRRLVIDNLKAAVARADWYDPEVHLKLQSFAAHYGIRPLSDYSLASLTSFRKQRSCERESS